MLVAVRGGQRSRGRGRRWTLDCASDLHRPVRLCDVWCRDGGVPQWLQGGRGVGPWHFNTQTGVILVVRISWERPVKQFGNSEVICTDLGSFLSSLFVLLA